MFTIISACQLGLVCEAAYRFLPLPANFGYVQPRVLASTGTLRIVCGRWSRRLPLTGATAEAVRPEPTAKGIRRKGKEYGE